MPIEERVEALKTLYWQAINQMPSETKVVVFWGNQKVEPISKLSFEHGVRDMLYNSEVYYTKAAWSNEFFRNWAIRPKKVDENQVNSLLKNWLVNPEDVAVEYR